MVTSSQLIPLILASLVLVSIPGPAVMFLVARSMSEGKRVGVASAAGVAVGNLCHALFAAFGVSAILASSPLAFTILKWAGAGYLIWLGVRGLLEKPAKQDGAGTTEAPCRTGKSVFRDGMMVGLLNPKVALFLLAFLPQFVNPEAGRLWLQFLILGLTFVLIGWAGDTLWALASGWVGGRFRKSGTPRWGKWLSSAVFLLLGVTTLLWKG